MPTMPNFNQTYTSMQGSVYNTATPAAAAQNETPMRKMSNLVPIYDGRQPKGLFVAKKGQVLPEYEQDPTTHKNIEKLIESNLLKTPAETIY